MILNNFYFGKDLMVLKELIFNRFYFWEGVVVFKELISNSFYLGKSGGLERTDF